MWSKAGSVPVIAILLAALAGAGAGTARAQDTCLGAPNGPAPAGSHWYYRTDQSTQRKCWYVRPRDQTVQKQKPAAAVATAAPAPASPTAVLDRPPWIDPTPPVRAATVAWPDPPPLPPPANDAGTSQLLPSSADTAAQETPGGGTPVAESVVPPAAEPPPTDTANEHGSNGPSAVKTAADPGKLTAPASETSIGMILAGVIVLLIAGLFLRRVIIKTMAPRPKVRAGRREPVLINSANVRRPVPTLLRHSPNLVPGHAAPDHRVGEVEEALQKLAQRLRRRPVTPSKPAANFFLRSPAETALVRELLNPSSGPILGSPDAPKK